MQFVKNWFNRKSIAQDDLKKLVEAEVKKLEEKAVLSPGVYGTGGLAGTGQVRDVDRLTTAQGLNVYKEMAIDDQVKPALMLKKLAILAGGWEITAASDEPDAIEQAEFMEFNFENMDGSIEKSLLDLLTCLDFGFALEEKLFMMQSEGRFINKIVLKALKSKDVDDFEFIVDKFGNIITNGLVQLSTGLELPINKFLNYAYDSQFGNVYGRSDLRAAHAAWFSKHIVLKGWNMYCERFGLPIPVGLYKGGMTPANQSILKNIFDTLQFKTSMVLPEQLIADLKVLEVNGTGSDIFEKAVARHDRAIARSILVPDQMGLGGKESGSMAKAVQQFNVFMMAINQLQQEIAEHVMKEQLIKPLIDINFGKQEKYPTFSFKVLKGDARHAVASIWITAVKDGVISQDLTDENVLRDLLDFPVKAESEEGDEANIPEFNPEDGTDTEADIDSLTPEPDEDEDMLMKVNACALHNHALRDRELTSFERKVDFQEIESAILDAEKEMFTSVRAVIVKQEEALIKTLTFKMQSGSLSPQDIRQLSLPFQPQLTRVVKEGLVSNYKSFRVDATKEIASLKKMAIRVGTPLLPQQAINFFTNKSFIIAGTINDQLSARVKQDLLTGLKEGLTTQTIINNIQQSFLPYVGDPLTDPDLNTPHRLETIVRTNLNEAYNQGRKDAFAESVQDGFVIGYFYSAIIDGRQTEICNFLDGLILPVNDSRTDRLIPPNHFNERSVIVPVTRDEAPVTFATDAELNRGLTLRNATNF